MIYEIVNNENYLLIVDNKSIKYDDHYVDNDNLLYMQKTKDVILNYRRVLAHLPLNSSPHLEEVFLLPKPQNDITSEKPKFFDWESEEEILKYYIGNVLHTKTVKKQKMNTNSNGEIVLIGTYIF